VEDIDVCDGAATLRDSVSVAPGQNIHRRASDLPQGAVILKAGQRLLAPQIAVAASVGKKHIRVARPPAVAIVSTGDELVGVDETPALHQIRMSNAYALRAALALRHVDNVKLAHLKDSRSELRAGLEEILQGVDVLLLSGGVSMGKFDYVPEILGELGVKNVFHKVSQRPGKPFWFGATATGQPVFALPGNPVSAVICAHRYVLPQLDRAMGLEAKVEQAALNEAVTFAAPLTYFMPVRLTSDVDGKTVACPAPTNGSGDFAGLVDSDGFVELDKERSEFPKGFIARAYRWAM